MREEPAVEFTVFGVPTARHVILTNRVIALRRFLDESRMKALCIASHHWSKSAASWAAMVTGQRNAGYLGDLSDEGIDEFRSLRDAWPHDRRGFRFLGLNSAWLEGCRAELRTEDLTPFTLRRRRPLSIRGTDLRELVGDAAAEFLDGSRTMLTLEVALNLSLFGRGYPARVKALLNRPGSPEAPIPKRRRA